MTVTPQTSLEQLTLSHLWVQSTGVDWDELAHGEALKVFSHAEGSTVTDIHGRSYLDGLAGLFVVAVGHGRTAIGTAMADQAGQLSYVAASRYTTGATATLAATLAELSVGDLSRTHFCSSGSEAVETAIKIAKQAQTLRGFPKRYKVIARRGSYHGGTYGAMSLTSARSEPYFGPFMAGVSFVPSPNRYKNDFGLADEAGDIMCARAIEQEVETEGPETVAAVIAEPISANNGVHIPSPVYWQMIRELCDKHGIFLIMDEVINGFGRTGKLFGSEHFGVVPDMITIAKGLSSGYAPIGAVVARPSVFEEFTQPGTSLNHLLTFGGHPVCAAAANANLSILLEEALVEASAQKGAYLLSLLQDLHHHPTVGDVRGIGLLCGVELVKNKETRESWGGPRNAFCKMVQAGLEKRGLLTRVRDVLLLSPPLVVTNAELEQMVTIIDETLTDAETAFAAELDQAI